LRVSHVASDRGVRIMCSICRYSANSKVLHEMLHVGAVSKLCLVLQVDSNRKTRDGQGDTQIAFFCLEEFYMYVFLLHCYLLIHDCMI
jgi:hypothetical protein